MIVSKRPVAVVGVVSLASLLAAPAGAQPKDPPRVKCDDHPMIQPFAAWDDLDHYALAPDGSFENKVDKWVLTGGARAVGGEEPFRVLRRKDVRSLELPSEGEATSGEVCVGVDHPSLRFFVKQVDGPADAVIRLVATVRDADGRAHEVPIPTEVAGTREWRPSVRVVVADPILAHFGEGTVSATFTFKPSPGSSWRIDDLYIDPWRSR